MTPLRLRIKQICKKKLLPPPPIKNISSLTRIFYRPDSSSWIRQGSFLRLFHGDQWRSVISYSRARPFCIAAVRWHISQHKHLLWAVVTHPDDMTKTAKPTPFTDFPSSSSTLAGPKSTSLLTKWFHMIWFIMEGRWGRRMMYYVLTWSWYKSTFKYSTRRLSIVFERCGKEWWGKDQTL